jgi:hypothetical protein
LDALIVFAEIEEEFADNVEKILDRLREYNITCNPEKCRFGHTSVEYLGHVIDALKQIKRNLFLGRKQK